jgi:hypothetical protein
MPPLWGRVLCDFFIRGGFIPVVMVPILDFRGSPTGLLLFILYPTAEAVGYGDSGFFDFSWFCGAFMAKP